MEIKDIIATILLLVFIVKFLIFYFGKHPSDKYHNDSWKTRWKK